MNHFTKPFSGLSKKDADIAGGKGASLGEMLNAGIPVPNGFVVLSTTFDEFIRQAGIAAQIEAILETVDHKAVHTVDAASEQIQELIRTTPMPEAIASEAMSEFENMKTEYVAVRSSATAEDGADHAWAGQLESYLNVTRDSLLLYVQQCWASLFTPRAIFYRFEKGLRETAISVAVVVQKMVNSEKSGIAFSVHPVTEDYNQVIIEAGLGLGEAIVSGSVTPDSYVVEKDTKKIIECTVNSQSRALYRKEGGGNSWKDLSPEEADRQVLSETEISALAEIIMGVENHYGFPCDIEWAYEEGTFYIVQSRPITTLQKKPQSGTTEENDNDPAGAAGQKKNLILDQSQESSVESGQGLAQRFLDKIGSAEITKQEGNFSMLNYISFAPGCFAPYMGRYYDFDFGSFVFFMKGKWGLLTFDFTPYIRTTDSAFKRFIASKGKLADVKDFKKTWKEISVFSKRHTPAAIAEESAEALKGIHAQALDLYCTLLVETVFSEALDERYVREKYREITGSEDGFEDFFAVGSRPVFDSFVLRNDEDIIKYARKPEAIQYVFADYYSVPDFEECQRLIKERIDKEGGIKGIKNEIKKIKDELGTNKTANASYRKGLSAELKYLFDYMQLCMYIRDIRKDGLQKIITAHFNIAAGIFDKIGLDRAKVAYATGADFSEGLYLKPHYPEEIERRERQGVMYYADAQGSRFAYEGMEEAKEMIFKAMTESAEHGGELKGNSGYKGKATGRCNIVVSEADFDKFKEGDILVTSMTRPEFVPLMKKAAAVITDEGGITCHAAIVSRELKLPCIIGTKMATRILKDGDLVEVDADAGTVSVIND